MVDSAAGSLGGPAASHGNGELLQAARDSMFDPHVVLSAIRGGDGTIVDFEYVVANDAACRFNRVTHAELVGARLLDLHPAAGTTGLLDGYRAVVETGEPLVLDDWLYPQDILGGEERRYDVRAVRVGDGLSQTWRDVTGRYATDQKLRGAMQEYRLLAQNAADVVVRTRNGIALWVSPSSAEQLGYQPEELIGTDVTDLVHPDDRALIADARQDLAPGRASRLRYRVRTAWGAWKWMQVDSRLWISDSGEVDGVVGTMRDVDAEVAAQRALQRSQMLYRGVFRTVCDGLIVLSGGVVIQVNPAAAQMLGVSKDGLVGCRFEDLEWDVVATDGTPLSHDRWPITVALRGGATSQESVVGLRGIDGSVRWLAVGIEAAPGIVSSEATAAGRQGDDAGAGSATDDGMVLSLTDVTDLRRAEQQLAAEHARLELLLTSIGLSTWEWRVTADEIVFDVGWTALTGHHHTFDTPMRFDERLALVHPDDVAATQKTLLNALHDGPAVYDMEYRVRHRDGRWIWLRERAHVVRRDAAGNAEFVMGTLEDIGELKEAQVALQASEAHYRILAENASSIVSLADSEGRLQWVSASVKKLLHWDPDELQAIDIVTILHPEDLPAVRQAQQRVSVGEEVSFEARARTPDHVYRWFEVMLRPTFDDEGKVTGRVAGWRDIDTEYRTRQELARSRERMRVLASRDPLTGLYNRREFTNVCEAHLAEGKQASGLLFIDVDHFKAVNDTYGHSVGDAVLKTIAERVVGCCKESIAGRFGGDEFLILLPQASDEASLARAAQAITQACGLPMTAEGVELAATVSVGGALSVPGDDLDSLAARADEALYQSKRAGRARWAIAGVGASAAR